MLERVLEQQKNIGVAFALLPRVEHIPKLVFDQFAYAVVIIVFGASLQEGLLGFRVLWVPRNHLDHPALLKKQMALICVLVDVFFYQLSVKFLGFIFHYGILVPQVFAVLVCFGPGVFIFFLRG